MSSQCVAPDDHPFIREVCVASEHGFLTKLLRAANRIELHHYGPQPIADAVTLAPGESIQTIGDRLREIADHQDF